MYGELAMAAAIVLGFFGSGLHPISYLAWLAPLPVFLVAPRVSAFRAFRIGFLAVALANINMWTYDRLVTPLDISVLLLVAPALGFAAVVLVLRRFALRGETLRAALSAPALTVAVTYLSEFRSPHSTWGNPAYTQMNFLPVIQVASITGIWGIGFLLVLLPAAVAAILSPGAARRVQGITAAVTAGIFILALGFGAYRLRADRLDGDRAAPQVKIGLIASDSPGSIFPKGSATVSLVRGYAREISVLAAQGTEVIVLPEKIGRMQGADLATADAILESAARDNHVAILAGFEHQPNLNEARLYSPDGRLEATYEKHHMLPAFESYLLPGTARVVVARRNGKWGIEICKDMDFPSLSRQYARDGAGLMLVPAWDFVDDGWLHSRMAILRGVESGFSIARSAKQGLLTLTDDRGRVLAERASSAESPGAAPFSELAGKIPVHNEPTFYDRAGNWFAWADLVLVLFLFIPLRRIPNPASRI